MCIGACANGLWACTDGIHFVVEDAYEIQSSSTEAFVLLKVGFAFIDLGDCKADLKEQNYRQRPQKVQMAHNFLEAYGSLKDKFI